LIKEFKDKTALITGAASGLGLEFSKRALILGMNLIMIDINDAQLKKALIDINTDQHTSPSRIKHYSVDVSSASEMQSLADRIRDQHDTPSLVINNAGVSGGGLVWENSVKDWERVLGVNLMGVINGVRLFTPMMLEASKSDPNWTGHIVNTASMAGLLTPPNMGIYNVSKHAVVALTETLYQDLALVSDQVTASVLCPYFVPTSINQSFNETHNHKSIDSDESKNSPAVLTTHSQKIGKEMLDKAVNSGKVSAADVAIKVFDAISQNQFYIFSHPKSLANVQERMQAILDNKQPPNPFSKRPEIGEELKIALRSAT